MTEAKQQAAAKNFSRYWKDKGYEKGECQPFWIALLRDVYGVEHPEEYIVFEDQVHLDHTSFIDGRIPTTKVLIEQKSLEKNLKKPIQQSDGTLLTPFQQAKRYITELPLSQHPRWVITCNFSTFLIYDMEYPDKEPETLLLENLEKEYHRLDFLVDSKNEHIKKEISVSKKAGEIVGKIYDAFSKQYVEPTDEHSLKSLNKLCVRLVFCLYAEDAGIFGRHGMFHDYLEQFDVRGMRRALIDLFKILDTKEEQRDPYLKDDNPLLAEFPYVNGGLFADENVEIPSFTEEIRELLLKNASENFNWSEISPTIFGAVFESTLNPDTRRKGGMHYTSIENIHKVIDPLFLEELKKEFLEISELSTVTTKQNRLEKFQNKLANLTFLDPACGSGNFLTETYLSLRRLENQMISEMIAISREKGKSQVGGQIMMGGTRSIDVKVSIDQFYGIEINDFAVTVAKTALWIAESQMLKETEEIVLMNLQFLPLKTNAYIREDNALCIDWNEIAPKTKFSYIMGNPPFVGARKMSTSQKTDMLDVIERESENPQKYKNFSKDLDYVTAWYFKAARYIKESRTHVGFVSTSSICQGEQVYPLWNTLIHDLNVQIEFAYKPFKWGNESQKSAQVFVTVIGFSYSRYANRYKKLFCDDVITTGDYISPYLMLENNVIVKPQKLPFANNPKIAFGNQPRDGGHLILSEEEKNTAIKREPQIEKWIRPYIGTLELTNGTHRYCLWLKDAQPQEIARSTFLKDRVQKTQEFRANSKAKTTNQYAKIPARFAQLAQPETYYLAIPEVSTSKRKYIPMGFCNPDIIASNKLFVMEGATLYHFGVLESNVHMAWVKVVAGRLGDGFNYSKELVYNPFPWPTPSKKQKERIEQTAQEILNARALYSDASLADLYNDITMPNELRIAHQQNDKAVMDAYGFVKGMKARTSESVCVTELMKMYRKLIQENQ